MYITAVLVLLAGLSLANSQSGPFGQKPGQCPAVNNVRVCHATCFADIQCRGIKKCCRTPCRGSICINPETQTINAVVNEKPGSCPSKPTGPWVCSSRCAVDSDCRKKRKCCKNRCGALACVNPEVELNNEVF